MKDMSLIMEGWRGFLNEQTEDRGSPSHTKYTDRIDRLVGVTEKAVLHLKKFLEHLETIYDQANIKKGGGGYTYLGLGKKWPRAHVGIFNKAPCFNGWTKIILFSISYQVKKFVLV